MICSSLNRLPVIRPFRSRDGLYFKSRAFSEDRPIVAYHFLTLVRDPWRLRSRDVAWLAARPVT